MWSPPLQQPWPLSPPHPVSRTFRLPYLTSEPFSPPCLTSGLFRPPPLTLGPFSPPPPNYGASQSTLSNFEVQSNFGSGVLQLLRLFETRMQGMLEVQTTQIRLDMISMAHKIAAQ